MKIILATDGSKFSNEATKKLGEMISMGEETYIKIINAVGKITPPIAPFSKDKYLAEEKALHQAGEKTVNEASLMLREILGKKSAKIETETIDGDAKEVILREAKDLGADLIVLGSNGHGFWDRMLLGSVSDAVVQYATCSVLIVRI